MSVYRPKDCASYRYDFWFKKQRYLGSTEQTTQKAAEQFETAMKDRLRREHAQAALERASGIPKPLEAPRFSDWAVVYRDHVDRLVERGLLTRPERVHVLIRVVLRFFGGRPSGKDPQNQPIDGEPYHDLRLTDPITTPQLIADFETWMSDREIAGQTKNQYRSTVRQMFQLALQPKWRAVTGVQLNPMDGIYRDRQGAREVTLTAEELRSILSHASYHLRLAVAIGALAPKLRLANILALEWKRHFDADFRFITVHQHKTVVKTRRPLVVPISDQLREVLRDAKRRAPATRSHVITYQRKPIKSLRVSLKNAVEDAGLVYGRAAENGVTFHTLRHTAATILAELDLSESKRQAAMGHRHLATTQKYTHLRPMTEIPIVEALSSALPIVDLVTVARTRAVRKKPAPSPAGDRDAGATRRPGAAARHKVSSDVSAER